MGGALIYLLSAFVKPKFLRYAGLLLGFFNSLKLSMNRLAAVRALPLIIYIVIAIGFARDVKLHLYAAVELSVCILVAKSLVQSRLDRPRVANLVFLVFLLHFIFSYWQGFTKGYYEGIFGNRNLSAFTLEMFYLIYVITLRKIRGWVIINYLIVALLIYYSNSRKIQIVHLLVLFYFIYSTASSITRKFLILGVLSLLPVAINMFNRISLDAKDKNELLRLHIYTSVISELSEAPFTKRGLNNGKFYAGTIGSGYTQKEIDTQSNHLELMIGLGIDGWMLYWMAIFYGFKGKNWLLNALVFASLFWIDFTLITYNRVATWLLLYYNRNFNV
jgi:hypothetical protein